MCLYSTLVKNPKYKKNKKNGGIIPPINDERILWVPIGCGNCIECRKQKGREWQLRMMEEIRTAKNGKFVTLTFSEEKLAEWTEEIKELDGYELENEIATRATRMFLEDWRNEENIEIRKQNRKLRKEGRKEKANAKAIRHWLITELGHEGTERIHLHGIIWTDEPELIRKHWKNGHIWPRRKEDWKKNWVSEQTVNYIIKYITKMDKDHETYKSKILTSKGIGRGYTERLDSKRNKYAGDAGGVTIESYKTRSGHEVAIPTYWRNKIYSETEREKLWIEKLDKQERWVMKERIDISKGEEEYYKALKYYQRRNEELGYGNDKTNSWEKKEYEKQRRNLIIEERIKNNNKKK